MSLDQLLDDHNESPRWTNERRRLIRFFIGGTVVLVGAVIGFFLISSTVGHDRVLAQKVEAVEEKSDSLKELMKVRDQAEALRKEIDDLHEQDSRPSGGGSRASTPSGAQEVRAVNYNPGEGFLPLQAAQADVYIPTGAVFRAQLLTPIKTSVERTFVMAEVTNDFRMDSKRQIPMGSKLIGRSRLNPVLKGVIVEFETLVTPNGIESPISGLALSRNALPEIEGLYFSDRATTYGTAMAFGFLSGFADGARTRDLGIWGSTPQVSLGNQALSGLSTASFQVANEMLNDIRANAVEYVVVPAGERVFVVLTSRYNVVPKGQQK